MIVCIYRGSNNCFTRGVESLYILPLYIYVHTDTKSKFAISCHVALAIQDKKGFLQFWKDTVYPYANIDANLVNLF